MELSFLMSAKQLKLDNIKSTNILKKVHLNGISFKVFLMLKSLYSFFSTEVEEYFVKLFNL